MEIRQVVESALVPFGVIDLVSLVSEEHGQTLSEVGLKADVLSLESIHKVGVLPVVASHMGVVNEHGLSLLALELLGTAHIVVHLRVLVVLLSRVHLEVGIVTVESETIMTQDKVKKSVRQKISDRSENSLFYLNNLESHLLSQEVVELVGDSLSKRVLVLVVDALVKI